MAFPADVVIAPLAPFGQVVSTSTTSSPASQSTAHTIEVSISIDPLKELQSSLDIMQGTWFDQQKGSWPTAIAWTSSVINTVLLASLQTIDAGTASMTLSDAGKAQMQVREYFTDTIAYYNHESMAAFAHNAIDDMLWVVLGWLEAIKFLDAHTRLFPGTAESQSDQTLKTAFAERAKMFYNVAAHAWDTSLCGGGILWNPVIMPYKNAITNQLYISAAIGMHLYISGGNQDDQYLRAAIEGYDWLNQSGMTNQQGLYVDGFHVSGYDMRTGSKGSGECDLRTEDVYTYNQGVVLSGLRGLWKITGNEQYLQDGYSLVDSTIAATGWDGDTSGASPITASSAGLGSNGILEDNCDPIGNCTQNSHTFKAAYFHHLTTFCEPLSVDAARDFAVAHDAACRRYGQWVEHNARAALATRNSIGQFGEWWSARGESRYVNERGRGRTVESHAGGVSVVRAWEEFRKRYDLE